MLCALCNRMEDIICQELMLTGSDETMHRKSVQSKVRVNEHKTMEIYIHYDIFASIERHTG